MPDRVIRDELMRSPRYRKLSSDTARLLFIHILLTVDSLGNAEASLISIGDMLRRHLDDAPAAKLLSELADADLVRLYEVDGKPYLHVPRFRQRLRYLNGKHPRPPKSIECKEINALLSKVRPESDCSLSTVGRSEEKRSEVIRKEALPVTPTVATSMPEIKTGLERINVTNQTTGQRSRDEQIAYVKAHTPKG